MQLSALTKESILSLEAPAEIKKQALHNLDLWLNHEEFKDYRPQIEYLISEKKWAGLLDRFSQILPFGTGGRRGFNLSKQPPIKAYYLNLMNTVVG